MFSGTPFERPIPLERPLFIVNLKIKVLIFTPDERPHLWCNRVTFQEWVPPYLDKFCTEFMFLDFMVCIALLSTIVSFKHFNFPLVHDNTLV